MGIKTYRPITPSLRFKTTLTNEELTADRPHKPLTRIKLRTGGRRNAGDITCLHQNAIDAVLHNIRDAADRSRHHGDPGPHGLQQCYRHAFRKARKA